MSNDEPNKHASELSKLGASKGGRARASVLTATERQEMARSAVAARWRKAKGPDYLPPVVASEPTSAQMPPVPSGKVRVGLYSMFKGALDVGDLKLECHVLNDGRRVFTQREMVRMISGGRESGNLARYLESNPLTVGMLTAGPGIEFKDGIQPNPPIGFEATFLVDICSKYLEAREKGLLKQNQLPLARQAEILLRACAKVGIIALIDEATGFEKVRKKQALQLKLQAFIADDIQEWARMFPEEFWIELARLEGVSYSPRSRPLRWGKYVMAFVYDAIDKDVGKKLRELNPDSHFRKNHHQWLKEFGRDKVNNQLHRVIGTMQACETMDEFKRKFERVLKKNPLQLTFDFIGDA
jgi:hypothetical protein